MTHNTTVTIPAPPIDETVVYPGEVMLFGQRWPIAGQVRRKSVTPMPQKTTQGDYNRADRIIESEWVVSDWTGGLGIQNARTGRDDDRYSVGTLEARYRFLTLGPLVTQAGTLAGPINRLIDFNESLYAIKGLNVHVWNGTAWVIQTVDADTTMSGASFRDAYVHDGSLYILTDTTLYRFDGTTWSNQAVGGRALCSFDDKLWRLDNAHLMNWAVTATITTWTAAGSLLIPVGYCKQLIPYFDQTGAPAIHAVTRIGLFGYDFDTAKFYNTPLSHPAVQSAGGGACVWQGALYVPVGSSLYKYTGNVVQSMGPDKDEGLPQNLQGDTIQAVSGYGFLFSVLNARTYETGGSPWPNAANVAAGNNRYPLTGGFDVADTGVDIPSAPTKQDWTGYYTTGFPLIPVVAPSTGGAVLVSPGAAWHIISQHPRSGAITEMSSAIVAGLSTSYRLWMSDSNGIYYSTLPTGLHNPLQNPIRDYAASGYLETAWQDMGWAEIDKIALSLVAEADHSTSTETITISIGYDDEPEWEVVGTMDESGRHIFQLGGTTGKRFHSVRLRFDLVRGSDTLATPVLSSISLGYLKVPRQLDGWEVTLDLTEARCRDVRGGVAEAIEELYDLKRRKKAGYFTYKQDRLEPTTRRVWLHEVIGVETVGAEAGGKYSVLLLEMDNWEAETFN